MKSREEINSLTQQIINAAIEVHRVLGPGLLESAYQTSLLHELHLRGLYAQREVEIPLEYKGVYLEVAYRADIIVENEIIIELKATDNDNPVFYKQLLTYLRLSQKPVGLLINFNKERLTEGLKRIINTL